MDPFVAALDAQYRAAGAVAAVFTPVATGTPQAVTTLRYDREAGLLLGPGNTSRALRYEFRKSELPLKPVRGDLVAEARGTFKVAQTADIGDIAGGVWLCDVEGPL